MGRKSTRTEIRLSDGERKRLERVAGHPRSLRKHAWRARIVPGLGSGLGLMGTIRRTGMSKPTVWRWRDRFLAEGVDGLLRDATRPPGKKPIKEDKVKAPVDLAMSPPPAHARHWTLKALAGEIGGMEATTVRNILRRHGLKPHQVKTSHDGRIGNGGKGGRGWNCAGFPWTAPPLAFALPYRFISDAGPGPAWWVGPISSWIATADP